MLRSRFALIVFVLAASLTLIAGDLTYAQGRGQGRGRGGPGGPGGLPSAERIFQQLDKNADGKLLVDELPADRAARLKQADADGDGAITKAELEESFKKLAAGAGGPGAFDPEQMFQRLDKNGDGKLTKDELPERMAQFLMRADADADGALTKEELAEARKKFAAAQPALGAGGVLPTVDEIFPRLDKNGDGKLSKDELPDRMAQWLMRADVDGNGSLSKEELQKSREQFRGRQGVPKQ